VSAFALRSQLDDLFTKPVPSVLGNEADIFQSSDRSACSISGTVKFFLRPQIKTCNQQSPYSGFG
jgi:hypothetical protein